MPGICAHFDSSRIASSSPLMVSGYMRWLTSCWITLMLRRYLSICCHGLHSKAQAQRSQDGGQAAQLRVARGREGAIQLLRVEVFFFGQHGDAAA